MEGVKKMMADKGDCMALLVQLKAIRSAVDGIMDLVIEERLETCMETLKKEDKELLINIKKYVKSN